MKKNDLQALHQMSIEELRAKLSDLEKEYHLATMNNAARKLANTASLKMMRKDIAVYHTIIREKELAAQVQ